MIVALGFFSGDVSRAIDLLAWIHKLGGCKDFEILLVMDGGTPLDQAFQARVIALEAFRKVHLVALPPVLSGWPLASNKMWRAAALWCEAREEDWLWMESDAIPLTPDWLVKISNAWERLKNNTEFLGGIYEGENTFAGRRFMSGIAVYSHKATASMVETEAAWDVSNADKMVSNGIHTPLIKNLFGQHHPPPSFVRERNEHSRPHEFDLKWLGEEAVLFHRDKTHSLLRLKRKQLFPNERIRPPIKVVFPVHNGDINQALHHVEWLRRLSFLSKWKHEAVVVFDKTTSIVPVNLFEGVLRQCFETVSSFVVERPPFQQYPHAANWMFQNTAHHMSHQESAWLWLEADAVVLRRDWLDRLQEEYETSCKDFLGVIVPHMLHVSGVAIYPPDAPDRMPSAMKAVEHAWDMLTVQEVAPYTHDAPHLLHHCWTLMNRGSHPVGGGELPANFTAAELQSWLPRSCVLYHRAKDLSFVNLLMSGQYLH